MMTIEDFEDLCESIQNHVLDAVRELGAEAMGVVDPKDARRTALESLSQALLSTASAKSVGVDLLKGKNFQPKQVCQIGNG